MRSSDERRAATLAHLYSVETKANPAKLGAQVLKSDLRRQGVSVAAKASKGDMARALKASPVVAANRAKVAALLQEARKSLGLRGTKTWSQANADYLASRLDEVAKLDLDEATLKQVREAAASIRAKGVTSGREARAQLLGTKPKAVRAARIKKDAAAVAADNQVRGVSRVRSDGKPADKYGLLLDPAERRKEAQERLLADAKRWTDARDMAEMRKVASRGPKIGDKDLALAAARDEGARSMRRGGRTQWNEEDRDAATDVYNKLMGFDIDVSPKVKVARRRAGTSPAR